MRPSGALCSVHLSSLELLVLVFSRAVGAAIDAATLTLKAMSSTVAVVEADVEVELETGELLD